VLGDRSAESACGERRVLRSVREESSEQLPAILRLAPPGRFRPVGLRVDDDATVTGQREGREIEGPRQSANRAAQGADLHHRWPDAITAFDLIRIGEMMKTYSCGRSV
jgi:hypothetical protein